MGDGATSPPFPPPSYGAGHWRLGCVGTVSWSVRPGGVSSPLLPVTSSYCPLPVVTAGYGLLVAIYSNSFVENTTLTSVDNPSQSTVTSWQPVKAHCSTNIPLRHVITPTARYGPLFYQHPVTAYYYTDSPLLPIHYYTDCPLRPIITPTACYSPFWHWQPVTVHH